MALGTLAVGLVSCATIHPEDLRSLQADPMAQADIPGATLTRTSEHDAQLGALMGKQEAAEILMAYTVQSGGDPASVKAEAVAQAQAAGWDIADPTKDVVQGTKRLETGDATIGLYFIDEDGAERLIVRLAHEFNHPTNRDG